jgi:cytoskeleton protein RodZ
MSEAVKLSIVPDPDVKMVEQGFKKLTVGERLALARSNQELSVDQIAGQLKWSARQIAEIEAGNYAVFPDMLSVRGFVRTYAKFLKIDSTPLMDELTAEFEKIPVKSIDRPKLDTPFPTGRMPWRHSNSPQKIFAVLVLIFLFLLAGFVYRTELLGMVHGSVPAKSGSLTENATVPQASSVLPEEIKPAVSASTEGTVSAAGEQKPVSVATLSDSGKSDAAQPVNVMPVDTTSTSQNNADVSLADSLALSFKQDSWVQVKRLDGTVVLSHLYRAGSQEVVAVGEPLNIVIGNAPGVEAKLRGQNLVLHAQDGSNVVNLNVK